MSFSLKRCVICQKELSQQESLGGNVCSDIRCKTANLAKRTQQLDAARKLHEEQMERTIEEKYQRELAQNGLSQNEMPKFKLPGIDSKSTEFTPEDKKEFLQFLIKMFRQARADSYTPESDERQLLFNQSAVYITNVSDNQELATALCSLCRGHCCQKGETFAYITPTMIRERLKQTGKRLMDLYRLYKSYLPETTITRSCVYHTDTGCTLPLELRADICNQFFCKPGADIIHFYRENPFQKTYVVAHNPEYIVREKIITLVPAESI